jgi:hypothetical protein
VLLLRLLSAGEAVLVDLVLDLVRRVRHVDRAVRVARAHLRLRALQRGEELGVHERGLRVLELLRDVTRQPEVRVLVDRARDQARHARVRAEDVRERVRERRRGLDRGEVDLADVVAVGEAERRARLAVRDLARDLGDVAVERAADVIVVAEDERLLTLEADCDDVLGVLDRKRLGLLDLERRLEQELFVV